MDLDLLGGQLGLLEALDQLDVAQNIALGVGQIGEQRVLEFLQADLEFVLLGHQGGLCALELGLLAVNDVREQLVLEAWSGAERAVLRKTWETQRLSKIARITSRRQGGTQERVRYARSTFSVRNTLSRG